MMNNPIESLLNEHLKELEDFNELLKKEKGYIEGNQLDHYAHLMNAKEALVQNISKQHQQITDQAGNISVEEYIQHQIKASPSPKQTVLTELWHKIKENTVKLEHQNQVNGMLIIASKNITERMLDLITGRQKGVYSKHAKALNEIESTKSQRI